MLLLIAGSTAAMAQTSNPFIVSYWTKTQNDTLSQVAFNSSDPNHLKYIRRQPSNNADAAMAMELTDRNGSYVIVPQTIYYPREDLPASVTYTNQCIVNYTAPDGTQTVTSPSVSTTVKASLKSDNCHSDGNSTITEVIRLEPIITVSGWNPQTVNVLQQILIGPQVVTFEWSYEDYGLLRTKDGMVALPTLQPEQPELIDITAEETAASQQASAQLAPMTITMEQGQQQPVASRLSSLGGGERTYEVTARFRLTLMGMNTSEPTSEELTFEAKYNVVFENKLVSTTYEKDYVWYESHDNMPLMVCYQIHRIRTYSTGEKETDTFTCPYGKMVSLTHMMDNWRGSYDDCEYTYADGTRVFYHKEISASQNDDYTNIFYYKTGISTFDSFSWKINSDKDTWNKREDLSNYIGDLSSAHYNPDNPQEGWYALVIQRGRTVSSTYKGSELRSYIINISYSDRLLYLDNQIIDFAEYRATHEFDFREENTTLTDGTPAKVFTHDCKTKYLGKDFYSALVDTVYQMK